MKIVFIGSSQFGLKCLKQAVSLPDIEVVGIVTNPKEFLISYSEEKVSNVLHADLSPYAEKQHIPIWQMKGAMTDSALIDQMEIWSPDFILVAGWYHKIPKSILEMAPTGGLHASLLPDYSGGAPLVWAMIHGEKKTGITFFLMDEKIDSGPIIGQAEESINEEDTITTLYKRIEEKGLALITEYLPKIAKGNVSYKAQDESKRRIMPQRSPKDGEINWNWSAEKIHDFVRAQTRPYPGAFTYVNEQKVIIWRGKPLSQPVSDTKVASVAVVHGESEGFGVCCGDGNLFVVREIGLEGGKTQSGIKFMQSQNISKSAVFGNQP